MQDLTLTTRLVGGYTAVELDGELDFGNTRTLRDRLLAICSGYGARVVLDLTRLRFCDAAGLNTLLAARNHALRSGGDLFLVGPQQAVAKVLRITELDSYFTVFATVAAATADAPHEKSRTGTEGPLETHR